MPRLYLGVDVGGTKVQSSLVRESGEIIGREKCPTPRKGGPERVVAAIEKSMDDMIRKGGITRRRPDGRRHRRARRGRSRPRAGGRGAEHGFDGRRSRLAADRPVQDADRDRQRRQLRRAGRNVARLGPQRHERTYICVGTGIGSGLVQRGKLWRGDRESAGEIGHMIMQLGGPKCGCGGRGCFEALASRTAIERDLREAIAGGRKSVLLELAGGDISVIRSGMIRKALDVEDELVTQVMRRAAEVLGYACVNVRHLIDPEAIVLGGGVIEACSDFIMPIVENIVGTDPLPGACEGGRVLLSALGDDAVVLGAVAAARKLVGRSPFKKRFQVKPTYPEITRIGGGEIVVDGDTYGRDIFISVGGKVKKRDEEQAKELYGSALRRRPEGVGEGLLRRAGNVVHRGRQVGQAQADRRCPPLPGPAVDPVRNPADGQGGRMLQPIEAPQGGADPRQVVMS